MDTSETYIKMRLVAIPDLGIGKPPNMPVSKDGVCWVDYTVFIDRHGDFYYSEINLKPLGEELKACQLERQDQLQAMVEGQLWDKFDKFHSWSHSKAGSPGAWSSWATQLTSMEQLWLAFVMKEKFNKTLNGTGWVKE